MRQHLVRLLALAVAVLCLRDVVPQVESQLQPPRSKPISPTASSEGKRIFESVCAPCHGSEGRGSQRAPNIASKRKVQKLSDAALFLIVQEGIPDTAMPAFHSLGDSKIKAVVSYLRSLQSKHRMVRHPSASETIK